ncbi:MAG: hypothetical protein WAK17_08530 [Candidatus Nitrosopolaris sp.]
MIRIDAVMILSFPVTAIIVKITTKIKIKVVNNIPNNRLKSICAINIIDPTPYIYEVASATYMNWTRNKNQFKCLQCGYEDMADYVAAINIAARAEVKQLIVADLISSYKPPILIAGS